MGQDLTLPSFNKTTKDTPLQNAAKQEISHEIRLTLEEEIGRFLTIHSFGIPIEIVINVHADYVKGSTPGARGIFHCPKCLAHWQRTGSLPESCDEAARFTHGPMLKLNISEAAKLVEAIKSASKFVSHTDISKILPLLNEATTEEERKRIIESISKRRTSIRSDTVTLGPGSNQEHSFGFDSPASEEYHEKNHQVVLQLTQAMRSKFMTSDPESGQRNDGAKIKSVGLKSGDGSFYPGFFVTHNMTSQEGDDYVPMTSPLIGEFPFRARGRYDDDGCYHPYRVEDPHVFSDVRFPKLKQMMTSQTREAGGSKNELASNFRFAFQEGQDLMLNELLSSGLWCTAYECYLVGMYDSRGNFNAACCVTQDGYIVPGVCDDRSKFAPLAEHNQEGNLVYLQHEESPELEQVLLQLRHLPPCPKASEISRGRVREWMCVRDGAVIEDATHITVFVNENNSDSGDEEMNVFIGGEIGPDGQLYPYGKYAADGSFIPGGPAIATPPGLVQISSSGKDNESPLKVHNYKTDKERDVLERKNSKLPSAGSNSELNREKSQKTKSGTESQSTFKDTEERSSRSTGELPEGRSSHTTSLKSLSSRSLSRQNSRDLRSQERIYNKKSDPLQRTPSIVFMQEKSAEELAKAPSRPPSAKPKQAEVLNPAVRNRTGKPSTKPGSLADAMMSTAQGETDSTPMKGAPQSGNYRDTVTRASFTADRVKSKDALRLQAAAKGSSTFDTTEPGAPQRPQTEGRGGLSRRNSSLTGEVGERRGLTTADKRRSQANVDGAKTSTPATVARQREIEKKTRKEKAEVKAKYQFAAHHSSVSGGAPDQDKLALGGTKPSKTGLESRQTSKRSLPGGEGTTSSQRLPRMRQVTGAPPGAPDKTISSRSMKRRSSSKFVKDHSTVNGVPVEEEHKRRGSKMTLEEMHKMNEKIHNPEASSDEDDIDFSDLSGFSSDEDQDAKRSSKKSNFFPFLDGFSILNFTENFRFSYFAVPGYIKEHNQKVRKGVLKLPLLTKKVKEVTKEERKERNIKRKEQKMADRNSLMQRIERLNSVDGN
uniref:ATP-sensitive inward rectifier potassium channel 1-like n=1 Tax=Phallusia mammillata TaxID=59560 RepID=A0A6F9DGG3_9ASCI|nr:ATP-sensitive inward rectifier potassium channel 1-like [Phallusia mammillata]